MFFKCFKTKTKFYNAKQKKNNAAVIGLINLHILINKDS